MYVEGHYRAERVTREARDSRIRGENEADGAGVETESHPDSREHHEIQKIDIRRRLARLNSELSATKPPNLEAVKSEIQKKGDFQHCPNMSLIFASAEKNTNEMETILTNTFQEIKRLLNRNRASEQRLRAKKNREAYLIHQNERLETELKDQDMRRLARSEPDSLRPNPGALGAIGRPDAENPQFKNFARFGTQSTRLAPCELKDIEIQSKTTATRKESEERPQSSRAVETNWDKIFGGIFLFECEFFLEI